MYTDAAAKMVFEVDGQKVIFIPFSEVKLVRRNPPAEAK
jgi:hypothetical protein